MSLNRVFILGRLGADPELRFTPSQMPVCSLRVATSERRKGNDGQWTEQTEWHTVVVWGKSAENCSQYLAKGRQVFIEGRLQTRKWQDQEGKDRYRTEIVASSVEFIGGKGEGAGAGMSSSGMASTGMGGPVATSAPRGGHSMSADSESSEMPAPVSFDDDDIPF